MKLDFDEGSNKVEATLVREMIDNLLYIIASRPDIMFRIYVCVYFQSNPKESHLSIVKKIFRYLKGT